MLRQEFEVLRRAPYTVEAWVAYSLKLRAFRGLLSNHAIAVKWTVLDNATSASAPSD